jgi:molybdenum cofactor cytidylyltransferase
MDERRPVVVVLAAGQGSRYKGPGHKLHQELRAGETVLQRTVAQVRASGLPWVVVTTQAMKDPVQCLVSRLDQLVVLPERGVQGQVLPVGMGHSIAAGVSASGDAPGWVLMPGDMPGVMPDTLRAVAEGLGEQAVAFAQHRGRSGQPLAFSAELYSDLVGLQGDEGARRLVARYPAVGVEVPDPAVLESIDTLEDLQRMREREAVGSTQAMLQGTSVAGTWR